MLYLDLPLLDRVKRITERGLQVEIWDWSTKDIDALAASGATFSSMTGYLRGDLTTPDGIAELLATAEESLAVAKRLDSPRLNLHGTGLDAEGPAGAPRRGRDADDVAHGRPTPCAGWPSSASAPGGCSRWRTSTWPSTTRARRSRAPPTRWRWPGRWTARTCG